MAERRESKKVDGEEGSPTSSESSRTQKRRYVKSRDDAKVLNAEKEEIEAIRASIKEKKQGKKKSQEISAVKEVTRFIEDPRNPIKSAQLLFNYNLAGLGKGRGTVAPSKVEITLSDGSCLRIPWEQAASHLPEQYHDADSLVQRSGMLADEAIKLLGAIQIGTDVMEIDFGRKIKNIMRGFSSSFNPLVALKAATQFHRFFNENQMTILKFLQDLISTQRPDDKRFDELQTELKKKEDEFHVFKEKVDKAFPNMRERAGS